MPEIFSTKLPNGLTVMLKEIHTAPIVSHWIWYRVGSRDEATGHTGISHWVEHMQFKGTHRFPASVLDRLISRKGGTWNAFTYLDWTTFYETMPASEVELALEIESDRMVNSLFDPEEVASERTVVISEREGNENEPMFQLAEEVQAAAFRVHPYHHEVIGDRADLERMTRDDLYTHYRTYYIPNNAVLAIAGDFKTEEMLRRVSEHYGEIAEGAPPPRLHRPEPPQRGERRVVVEGAGETAFIQVAFHAPQATHPDFFPLLALDSLLTGPTNLNLFSGGISNKTSALYRALVDNEYAVSVGGALHPTVDPFLYTIFLVVHPRRKPDEVIARLDDELRRVQDAPPTEECLNRALKQARALFAYGSESISNQAFWMGYSSMFADYSWYEKFLERLAAVTPDDVLRVARQYLRPQNRTLGVYLPTGGAQ